MFLFVFLDLIYVRLNRLVLGRFLSSERIRSFRMRFRQVWLWTGQQHRRHQQQHRRQQLHRHQQVQHRQLHHQQLFFQVPFCLEIVLLVSHVF